MAQIDEFVIGWTVAIYAFDEATRGYERGSMVGKMC